ncbi:F-box protein SKIP19 [Cardamine amara subsp. amara]|uniref:F-box protein SKIP19 n=1 Tax=Cardamine amara subsp. amara TaxID=228776 RepID=A0ABD1BS27_CARAN
MASSSVPLLMKDEEPRKRAELPSELISSIMLRLGAIEILENAQKVCKSWRRVSKDPLIWRKIDMHHDLGDWRISNYDLEIMCRHAVDRSQGGLVEIDIWHFGTDNLLKYIADSSSNLRSLRLANCDQISDEGVVEAVVKLPLLEDLEISNSYEFSGKSLRVVGQSCPNLKTLKLNCSPVTHDFFNSDRDKIAISIAESMPELRHLQLYGNGLTNTGLNAILDGCPHLEHLDLRECFNIDLVGDLEKRCSERIGVLRRPNDSTDDFPLAMFLESESDYDSDYTYGYDRDFPFASEFHGD